jgi:hypothetical protein
MWLLLCFFLTRLITSKQQESPVVEGVDLFFLL